MRTALVATVIVGVAFVVGASAGNPPAAPAIVGSPGQSSPNTIFSDVCVECHERTDWEGETTTSVEQTLRGIMTGKVKHKAKLTLTESEVIAMAKFLTFK
jgi:hypothetical protein